jgi:hypothetical protein
MDFSLLQTHSRHPLLRDVTALRHKWAYYVIMVLDPILRFSWIFYAIFTHDTQHSSICSFLVAFGEVTRRGMWTLFRVENEHCTNVASYRASRDVPLPYHLQHEQQEEESAEEQRPSLEAGAVPGEGQGGRMEPDEARAAVAGLTPQSSARSTGYNRPSAAGAPPPPTPGAAEQGAAGTGSTPETDTGGTVRRRRPDHTSSTLGRRSIAKIMADAHRQDFEKRRKPAVAETARRKSGDTVDEEGEEDDDDGGGGMHTDEDEDEDDDESGSMIEERMEVREAEGFIRKGVGKGSDTE